MNDAMLAEWQRLTAEVARLSALESDLRQKLFMEIFPDLEEGQSTIDIGNGWKLEGKGGLNYNLGKLDDVIAAIARLSPQGKADIVSWKPKLKVGSYRKLEDVDKAIVDAVLTVSKAMPSLKLIPPKG